MKTLFLVALLLLSSCDSVTQFGPCIGIADDKDPNLIYKLSGWNVAMGIIFIETVFVPIIVLVDNTFCQVGRKDLQQQEKK